MKKHRNKKQKPAVPAAAHSPTGREAGEPPLPAKSGPAMKPAMAGTVREGLSLGETDEPVALPAAMPVMLIALLAVMLYVADMYLMEHSGHFNALVYYPNTEVPAPPGLDLVTEGRTVYASSCAACHQAMGEGNRSLNFPPLAGSEWVLADGPARIIRIVLDGLSGPIEVKGQSYSNVMVPWRPTLSDEQIAAVLTFVRQEWGNKASPVTPEQVKTIREATASRGRNWTAAELLAIPDTL